MKIKKIIIFFSWIILIAGLCVLLVFVEREHQLITCKKLDIFIKYNSDDYFITVDDVNNYLASKGLKISGEPLYNIDAGEIESTLYSIPFIEKVDVFTTIEGNVEINIEQKKPIAKIFNKFNQSFYIDDKGKLMPSSGKYTARLIVANGNISDYYSPYTKLNVSDSLGKDTVVMKTAVYKIYRMVQNIDKDDFWKAMIEEIFINNKGDIELFTKIGEQTVIFGDLENMKEKFDNLLIFYKHGLNRVGWNKYKTINIKYKNQVVCSKI